jgi:hypothetical protein
MMLGNIVYEILTELDVLRMLIMLNLLLREADPEIVQRDPDPLPACFA